MRPDQRSATVVRFQARRGGEVRVNRTPSMQVRLAVSHRPQEIGEMGHHRRVSRSSRNRFTSGKARFAKLGQ
jgi:hypothetical protein